MFLSSLQFSSQQLHNAWGGFGNVLMGLFIVLLILRDIMRHGDSPMIQRLSSRVWLMSWFFGLSIVAFIALRISGLAV